VLANGLEDEYKGVFQKSMEVSGEMVTVIFNVVDGVVKIGNAWVQ
jgi:hypothetical protein